MGRLAGRTALITGAARGQGEAEARRFVHEGANVAIADILEDECRVLAEELGGRAMSVALDVTSEAQWATAIAAVVEHFGRLDVLVNNAAILHFATLEDTTLADYQRVIDVNQTGVFLGVRAAINVMGEGSSIVNISSIDGLVGTPGLSAYCASKFAVRGLTKAMALELAPRKIRVNSIHPGLIDTPMLDNPALQAAGGAGLMLPKIPASRPGGSSEVAALAVYLASDESSYSTGSEFVVDGGLTAGTYFPVT